MWFFKKKKTRKAIGQYVAFANLVEKMTKKKESSEEEWERKFGNDYTERNEMTATEYNELVYKRIGISRTDQMKDVIDFGANSVLEVGCNIGNQLFLLRSYNSSKELWGVDVNTRALQFANGRAEGLHRISFEYGSAYDLPFDDDSFDIVFTAGLLIHIPPEELQTILHEIHRCTKKYIVGFEYYFSHEVEDFKEVKYHGTDGMLWISDYAHWYLNQFDDLRMVKERIYPYIEDRTKMDHVFLLEKVR